jgi:hypothetical protein
LVQPLPQGQFTPLPEALCWVILDLTSSGQAAVLERIRSALQVAFPDIQRPSQEIVYDALAKLMAERKVNNIRLTQGKVHCAQPPVFLGPSPCPVRGSFPYGGPKSSVWRLQCVVLRKCGWYVGTFVRNFPIFATFIWPCGTACISSPSVFKHHAMRA